MPLNTIILPDQTLLSLDLSYSKEDTDVISKIMVCLFFSLKSVSFNKLIMNSVYLLIIHKNNHN